MTTQGKAIAILLVVAFLAVWFLHTRYYLKTAPEGRGVYRMDRWTGGVTWVYMGKEVRIPATEPGGR